MNTWEVDMNSVNSWLKIVLVLLVVASISSCKIVKKEGDSNVVTGTAIGWLQKPTSINSYRWAAPGNPDNLTEHSYKYINEQGQTTSDYTSGVGSAFRIKVENDHGHGLLGDIFKETIAYMYVNEYTFPKNGSNKTMALDWKANLHLDAYAAMSRDEHNRVWFEWVVMEDPLGGNTPLSSATVDQLKQHIENTQKYLYQDLEGLGEIIGVNVDTVDKRSGLMMVPPGAQPKLYLGVSAMIIVDQRDQYVHIKNAGQPASKPHAFFEVKGASASGNNVWYGPEYVMGIPK